MKMIPDAKTVALKSYSMWANYFGIAAIMAPDAIYLSTGRDNPARDACDNQAETNCQPHVRAGVSPDAIYLSHVRAGVSPGGKVDRIGRHYRHDAAVISQIGRAHV